MIHSSAARSVTYAASVPFVGGAELTQLQVLAALKGNGAEVHALLPSSGPLQLRLEALGIGCRYIGEPRGARYASRYSQGPLRRAAATSLLVPGWEAIRALHDRPGSILYCGGFRAQMRLSWAALPLRHTVVWHVHEIFEGAAALAMAGVGRAASRIIAVSDAAACQPGLTRLQNRVVAVRSGVPDAFFEGGAPRPGAGRIALVGHLTPMKDHAGFISLVTTLRGRGLLHAAAIIGKAPYLTASHAGYAEQVRSAARRAGIDVLGVSPEEMPSLLRRFDILVHLGTRPEGFGRAIAEAQALGVPVVTYDWGGAREIVRHDETGLLVEPGDVSEATDATARLLLDEPLRQRMAQKARDHASTTLRASPSARRAASEMVELCS